MLYELSRIYTLTSTSAFYLGLYDEQMRGSIAGISMYFQHEQSVLT